MKKQLLPVVFFSAAISMFFFISCNNAPPQPAAVASQQYIADELPVKEDTVISKIRPVLFNLQNQELSYNGRKPFDLTISNIHYKLISNKEYYSSQLADLKEQAKYSTNTEKTQKALKYLAKMINASADNAEIYKVQFHLKAQVDKTHYNSEKILYLKKDLSPLQLIFPQ